jgi:hypothetical protein
MDHAVGRVAMQYLEVLYHPSSGYQRIDDGEQLGTRREGGG